MGVYVYTRVPAVLISPRLRSENKRRGDRVHALSSFVSLFLTCPALPSSYSSYSRLLFVFFFRPIQSHARATHSRTSSSVSFSRRATTRPGGNQCDLVAATAYRRRRRRRRRKRAADKTMDDRRPSRAEKVLTTSGYLDQTMYFLVRGFIREVHMPRRFFLRLFVLPKHELI